MKRTLVALALVALSLSAVAAEQCSAQGFTLSKQKRSVDEFKHVIVTAELRNDNNVECSALVRLLLTDKADHDLLKEERLHGGSRPLGRPLMVGESQRVWFRVPPQLVPLMKSFELSVVSAKADK